MTSPTTASRAPETVDSEAQVDTAGMEDRGSLTINQAVVRKVAQRSADEAPGTARTERKIAGLGVGSHGAHVKVSGNENQVDLKLDLALQYPAVIPSVIEAIRTKVTEEVQHITSYQVRSLDVVVSALLPNTRLRVR